MFRVDPRGLGRICYHLVVEDWVLEETVEPFVVLVATRSLGMKKVHNENIYYCTYLLYMLYWEFYGPSTLEIQASDLQLS